MKMLKILFISAACGVAAFLLCVLLHRLKGYSGRPSDPIGSGLAELFAYVIYIIIGLATYAIVLVMHLKGAKVSTIIAVAIIPAGLNAAMDLVNFAYHYRLNASNKERERQILEINPFPTADREALSALLQAGEDINKTNHRGQTLLHYAAHTQDLDLMKFAVERGADVNRKDLDGLPPASYVSDYTAAFNPWPMLNYFARNGVVLTEIVWKGDDPLIFSAAQYGAPDDLALLIEQGASVHTLNRYGATPLFTMYRPCPAEKARILIDAGADVNFNSNDDRSPTPVFCYHRDDYADAVKLLIEAGAGIELRNKYGNTPLMSSIVNSDTNSAVAKVFIRAGADIHARNNEGDTPLLLAARHTRNPELLQTLVDRGADKSATDSEGKTAYDIAVERRIKAEKIEFLKPE